MMWYHKCFLENTVLEITCNWKRRSILFLYSGIAQSINLTTKLIVWLNADFSLFYFKQNTLLLYKIMKTIMVDMTDKHFGKDKHIQNRNIYLIGCIHLSLLANLNLIPVFQTCFAIFISNSKIWGTSDLR